MDPTSQDRPARLSAEERQRQADADHLELRRRWDESGADVIEGDEATQPDGTVTRTERACTRAEWVAENHERDKVQAEYRLARRTGIDLVHAGDRRKGAALVAEANRRYRNACAELDQRAKAQTTVTTLPPRPARTASSASPPCGRRRESHGRRPGHRRRSSGSSRTSGTDPGDDGPGEPEPPAAAVDRPPIRLSLRDVLAEDVWKAMREHADQISEARDVLRLPTLSDLPGERIAVAVADLVAQGRVVGGLGAGRVRAVQGPSA